MSEPDITREHGAKTGRYVLVQDGQEAELKYSVTSPRLVIAEHVGVPDALQGSGVGLALVNRLVADARAEHFKVVALCPFVAAQARRHPEWSDIFGI